MVRLKKVRMDELKDIVVLSDIDETVFKGYTVRQEVDLEGETRDFLEDEMKYFKVTSFHGGNLYLSQDKAVDVILGEAYNELEEGDIYAHGYPAEPGMIPSNHGEESEEGFVELYTDEYTEIIENRLREEL